MTARDQFAAAALTGLLASGKTAQFSDKDLAMQAYLIADHMLRVSEMDTLYRCSCGAIHEFDKGCDKNQLA